MSKEQQIILLSAAKRKCLAEIAVLPIPVNGKYQFLTWLIH